MPLAAAAVALACTLTDPAVTESSGAAAAPAPAWFFTHNDSGDRPRFFAVDRACHTLATYRVANATAIDWEDIADGPGATVWLADIGDNRAVRDSVSLYRVAMPNPARGNRTVQASRVELRYEDGPHDAETLLVNPTDGRIWVVTKDLSGNAGVYEARDGVLHLAATLQLDLGGATGGDIAPDGRAVAVRTYSNAYEWRVTNGDVAAALTGKPVATVGLPTTEQGEGLAYVDGGRTLLTTAEGRGAAVRTFPSSVEHGAQSPTSTASPATSAPNGGDTTGGPWPAVAAAGTVGILALAYGLVRFARRRGQ